MSRHVSTSLLTGYIQKKNTQHSTFQQQAEPEQTSLNNCANTYTRIFDTPHIMDVETGGNLTMFSLFSM